MEIDLKLISRMLEELKSQVETTKSLTSKEEKALSNYKAIGLLIGIQEESKFLMGDVAKAIQDLFLESQKYNALQSILSNFKGVKN